jgi:DNA-binding CsgD family transcriptional regulator
MVCFFCGGRAELWEPLHAAVARLKPRPPAVLSLCDRAFADPARTTGADLAELDATVGHLHDDADPTRIVWVGRAALFVDRMAGCREAHWRVVRDGRDGGAVASSIGALINLCLDDLLTGRWEEAAQLADEGIELCESHGYRLLRWPLWFGRAVLAASRGDGEAARALADRMARWAAPRRAGAVQLYAHHVRALDALGRGDAGSAYRHAAAVSAPGTLAAHVPLALWTAPDLVEAAVRAGRAEEAAAHAAAMNAAGLAALSPRLALVTAGATALSAPAADASPLFEAALAVPGAERWPFDLARVRLAYGERLRRLRAPSEARDHLAGALDAFQRLGAAPWVARTRTELRAAGLVTADRDDGRAALTPQEREIALLAATGLTNKQIGQRLHLSHRTVGAHLYRVFPKLGITSRAALRDALR